MWSGWREGAGSIETGRRCNQVEKDARSYPLQDLILTAAKASGVSWVGTWYIQVAFPSWDRCQMLIQPNIRMKQSLWCALHQSGDCGDSTVHLPCLHEWAVSLPTDRQASKVGESDQLTELELVIS
jgi:hypothetical protein